MLKRIRSWFGFRTPAKPWFSPGDPVPPGLQVEVPGSGIGVVSAFVPGRSGTAARVVFRTPRRTWIETVSLHQVDASSV